MAKKRKNSNEIITTINGLKVTITPNNIHIENSYEIRYPADIKKFLNDTKAFLDDNNITMETPFDHRSICSMKREWTAHNNAYYLNFRPEQSKSVDLNYPQPWYANIIYFFCSLIVI